MSGNMNDLLSCIFHLAPPPSALILVYFPGWCVIVTELISPYCPSIHRNRVIKDLCDNEFMLGALLATESWPGSLPTSAGLRHAKSNLDFQSERLSNIVVT